MSKPKQPLPNFKTATLDAKPGNIHAKLLDRLKRR